MGQLMYWHVLNIERLPKRGAFFMVSLAYLVKHRFVAPENRVRFPEIPQKMWMVNSEFYFVVNF